MEPRREHGTADLRGVPRKARESSNRFADEDLRLQLARERKAREEAERSNRVKSEFLALLSHEFRTPLQAMFGYTELLDAEIHGELNEAQHRYVLRIKQSQQHLLGLIDTILEHAKLESGQQIESADR